MTSEIPVAMTTAMSAKMAAAMVVATTRALSLPSITIRTRNRIRISISTI